MHFLASKIIGFFVVPSNFILILAGCGPLLWQTRFPRFGRRIVIASIILLLIAGANPLGTALLLSLENRFQPWDSSRGPPTGIIVLGGIINPEISVQRGDISLARLQNGSLQPLSSIIAIQTCASSSLEEAQMSCFAARPNLNLQLGFCLDCRLSWPVIDENSDGAGVRLMC